MEATLLETEFVSPDARFAHGSGGRQWFTVDHQVLRPERIQAARHAFDELISEIIEREGFQNDLQNVAFVGVSQDAIMALDAVASGLESRRARKLCGPHAACPDIILIRHVNLTATRRGRRDDTVDGIRGGKRPAEIGWLRCHVENLYESRSHDLVRTGKGRRCLPQRAVDGSSAARCYSRHAAS